MPAAFLIGTPDRSGEAAAEGAVPLTLMVKGTFTLTPGEAARFAEEMHLPTGDEPYEDDPDALGAPRYPSDFVPTKPRADLLLVGHCYPPGGRAAGTCMVRFEVGQTSCALEVHGDRAWRNAWLGPAARPTPPRPFERMPLRYERAHGGRRFKANPTGIGRGVRLDEDGRRVRPLPNVEDPARPVRSPRARVEPAGLGPLDVRWKLRRSKVGTYRKRWLKERWPGLPADFDPSYYNSAQPRLQVPFLAGDEPIRLQNLHPEHPELEAQLPGLRVRAFACDAPPDAPDPAFRELTMQLDTLWVDADALELVLVWRGQTRIHSDDLDEALSHLYVCAEAVETEPETTEAFRTRLVRLLEERALEEEVPDVEPPVREAKEKPDIEALAAQEKARLEAELAKAGVVVEESPEPTAEAKAKELELRERYGIDREKPAGIDRDEVIRRVADGESLAGADLAGLDLSEAALAGGDFAGAILAGTDLTGADLSEAKLDGATLVRACLVDARLMGAQLAEADLSGADLSRADVSEAIAPEATFEMARLDGARLDALDGPDAIFSEASLVQSSLCGAKLAGADFSLANVACARFEGAELAEAVFEGAQGEKTVFEGADLTELRCAGAALPGASFARAMATEAVFEGAQLAGASFDFAQLAGANFIAAALEGASLHAAELRHARLERAQLEDARMAECNLFDANLERASLIRADLSGAHLFGANLVDARMDGAELAGAVLDRTRRNP